MSKHIQEFKDAVASILSDSEWERENNPNFTLEGCHQNIVEAFFKANAGIIFEARKQLIIEVNRLKAINASLVEAAKLAQTLINKRKLAIEKLVNATGVFGLPPETQGTLGDYKTASNKIKAAIAAAEEEGK